jgi:hypothetical protein
MEDEDLGSQRKKWNETIRAKMLRDLFPNAPKRSRCRICKKTYPNSILLGSSLATSMCPECIEERIGKIKRKQQVKSNPNKEKIKTESTVIKEENLMTLKQYLEMKI